jgi:hypothetical protein
MGGSLMTRIKAVVVSLASVALGALVIAMAGIALAHAQPTQAALEATNVGTSSVTVDGALRTVEHVALTIGTYPDSQFGTVFGKNGGAHPDWVAYTNNNLVVPENSLVTITVNQYDGGEALNNPYFGQVIGTIGNNATVNGKTVRHWDPDHVGHTFTLRGIPGSGRHIFVSVPIPPNAVLDSCDPAAPDASICSSQGTGYYPKDPVVVKFSFYVGSKGVYQWNCEYPCGATRIGQFGAAMSTYGYMSGTLTVK